VDVVVEEGIAGPLQECKQECKGCIQHPADDSLTSVCRAAQVGGVDREVGVGEGPLRGGKQAAPGVAGARPDH
jgi:hypothetical protein